MKKIKLIPLIFIASLIACSPSAPFNPSDTGGNTDTDTVTDTDTEHHTESGTDSGSNTESHGSTDTGGNTESNTDTGGTSDTTSEEEEIDEADFMRAVNYSSYNIVNSKEELTYQDLFNLHNKVNIEVNVDNEELEKLEDDRNRGAKPEIYRLAREVIISIINNNVTYNFSFENVGIRQKGGVYSRESIFDGYGQVNTYNHYKLSFDETFTDTEMYDSTFIAKHGNNEYKDREFLGLSGLDIKFNRNSDLTHIKEIYASKMYNAGGIIHQQVGLSTFSINGRSFGLCNIYEQASKSLIKRTLGNGDYYVNMTSWKKEKAGKVGIEGENYGDLYKATYGGNVSYGGGPDFSLDSIKDNNVGIKTDIYGNTYPIYERKTAKKVDYNDELFKNAINKINNNGYSEIEKVVDLKYFAKYMATAFYVSNADDFRYNYNNYQIYMRRTDGKMIFNPIDDDRAFGIGETWPDAKDFVNTESLSPLSDRSVNGSNRNPLIAKTILASSNNECKELYIKYLKTIRNSDWVNNTSFLGYYNVAKSTYSNYQFSLSNGDNVSFEELINNKVKAVNRLDSGETPNEYFVNDKDRLYAVGTFNNWYATDEFKLRLKSEDIYAVSFVIQNSHFDTSRYNSFRIKFNNGGDNYSVNDYSISDNWMLLPSGGSATLFTDFNYVGHTLNIEVNVRTGAVNIYLS